MPGFEGQGFGTSLLQRCEEFLAQNGFGEAWLSTDRDTAAARFYARHGWGASRQEADAEDTIFRKRLSPAPLG